jgi:hypothetical protein
MPNTPNLIASLPNTVTCPLGHSSGNYNSLTPVTNGDCRKISYPLLYNNVFWQNRSFNITVGGYNNAYQNKMVSLVPTLNQPSTANTAANGAGQVVTGGTGACVSGANYWDIGVRGDMGPTNHGSGFTLNPISSVLTDITGYNNVFPTTTSAHNIASNPMMVSQYCNGSRVPPEFGGMGYQVPPGIADATVPNPIFNLTPAATVDEGNNWINMSWGPLAQTNPVTGGFLGNYAPSATSPVINYIASTQPSWAFAPPFDFFGNPRKPNNTAVDAGAVEFTGTGTAVGAVSPGALAFGNVQFGQQAPTQTLTLTNSGGASLTGITIAVTAPFAQSGGTCGASLGKGASCTIVVGFLPNATQTFTGTVTITASVPVLGSPVSLTGTGTNGLNVNPTTLTFTDVPVGTSSAPQIVVISGSATGVSVTASGPFSVVTGGASPCGPSLNAFTVSSPGCTFGVVFNPTLMGAASGSVTIASSVAVAGSPVNLIGNATGTKVTPTALMFGNVITNTISRAQTLTINNSASTPLTLVSVTFNETHFTRSGGSCPTTFPGTVAAASSCTINVVFHPTTENATSNGTVTIAGSYGTSNTTVFGSPVTLSGTGQTPALPPLGLSPNFAQVDNFNRATDITLGANWIQPIVNFASGIQLSDTATGTPSTGTAFCTSSLCTNPSNVAFWSTAYGVKQAASFQIGTAGSTFTNDALILGANGTVIGGLWTNFLKVTFSGNTATVASTTNFGSSYTTVGTLTVPGGPFQSGDTVTVMLDGSTAVASPTIYLWRTTSANVTSNVVALQMAPNALWQNGGQVGMQLPNGARVDNFAAGTVQ